MEVVRIFTAAFTSRDNLVGLDPVYLQIFDGVATEDAATNFILNGQPVGPGEFPIGPIDPAAPNAARLLNVRAAVLTFGRLLGENLAHECGHALGRPHDVDPGEGLMEEGTTRSFRQRTGIQSFDRNTGAIIFIDPTGFAAGSLTALTLLLGMAT